MAVQTWMILSLFFLLYGGDPFPPPDLHANKPEEATFLGKFPTESQDLSHCAPRHDMIGTSGDVDWLAFDVEEILDAPVVMTLFAEKSQLTPEIKVFSENLLEEVHKRGSQGKNLEVQFIPKVPGRYYLAVTDALHTFGVNHFYAVSVSYGSLPDCNRQSLFHTQGMTIRDQQGRSIILRGAAVIKKRDPYLPWHGSEQFEKLKQMGFNVIRLGIVWAALSPERGVFNEAYLDAIRDIVNLCAAQGIYVVLDMHQDVYGEKYGGDGAPLWAAIDDGIAYEYQEPWWINYASKAVTRAFDNFWLNKEGVQDEFRTVWTRVAAYFRDHPAVIGYDLLNEPYFGSYPPRWFEQTALQSFYWKLIEAISAIDPYKLFFVEPQGLTNSGLLNPKLNPFYFRNIVLAPHFYAILWQLNGGSYNDIQAGMRNAIRQFTLSSHQIGVPWWLGEYGITIDAQNSLSYLEDIVSLLERNRVGSSFWEYSRDNGFGLEYPDGSDKPFVDVLARTYPQRVGGDLLNYRFDPQSKTFEMTFRNAPGISGPSEIYLPKERHYPNGFTIKNSDAPGSWTWTWDNERSIILLNANPSAMIHKITITPIH